MEGRDSGGEVQVLTRLKSARKMEREAKDMFGKYLDALKNNTNDDEDVVEILEEKIQALKRAETVVSRQHDYVFVVLFSCILCWTSMLIKFYIHVCCYPFDSG